MELVISDHTCNKSAQLPESNPSIVDCSGKNVSQCLNSGRHLQLTTSPFECAQKCKGLLPMFMFGSNETDTNRCNDQGCICSCGQNIIANGECDTKRQYGFKTYQFVNKQIGRNLKVSNILPDTLF